MNTFLFLVNLGDKSSNKCWKSEILFFNKIYLFINIFRYSWKLTNKPFWTNFYEEMNEKYVKN